MVILWGKTRRVNPRVAKNGKNYTSFAIETWEGYPNLKSHQWHSCLVFGRNAALVHEKYPDGTTIGVMGRLQTQKSKHQDIHGEDLWETFVRVTQVTFNPPGFVANFDIRGE